MDTEKHTQIFPSFIEISNQKEFQERVKIKSDLSTDTRITHLNTNTHVSVQRLSEDLIIRKFRVKKVSNQSLG